MGYVTVKRLLLQITLICLIGSNCFIFVISLPNPKDTPTKSHSSVLSLPPFLEHKTWGEKFKDANKVLVNGSLAFVAGGSFLLAIVNISNPSKPDILGNCGSPVDVSAITLVDETTVVVSHSNARIDIVDISNLTRPVSIAHYYGVYARALSSYNHYLYVIDSYYDCIVFNLSKKDAPFLITRIRTNSSGSYGCFRFGNYLYLASGIDGLEIYDLSVPEAPQLIGTFHGNNSYYMKIIVENTTAYILDVKNNLFYFNISDKSHPVLTKTIYNTNLEELLISRGYLIGRNSTNHLEIFWNNGTNLTRKGALSFNENLVDFDVKANFTFLLSMNRLFVIDISNKSLPIIIATIGGGYFRQIQMKNDFLFLRDNNQRILILKENNQTNTLEKIASIFEENIQSFFVSDNYLYLACYTSGVRIYDISVPMKPFLVGTFFDGGEAYDIQVRGNLAFVADGNDSVEILDVSNKTYPIEIANTSAIIPQATTIALTQKVAFVGVPDLGLYCIYADPSDTETWLLGEIISSLVLTEDVKKIAVNQSNVFAMSNHYLYFIELNSVYALSLLGVEFFSRPTSLYIINENYLIILDDTKVRIYIIYSSELTSLAYYDSFEKIIDVIIVNYSLVLLFNGAAYDLQITGLDYDSDLLNDIEELTIYSTSIIDPDTDNDGLLDGEEVKLHTNPINIDTDFDGLSDSYEIEIGTDPLNNDTDGDGFLDGEEVQKGTNPLDPKSFPIAEQWYVYAIIFSLFIVVSLFLVWRIQSHR